MADLLYKRLENIDKEVEDKETELRKTLEELSKKAGDTILLAEYDRLVKALADVNARRRNLEDKLPAGAVSGSEISVGTSVPKTVDVVHVVVTHQDDKIVVHTMTFKDQKSLKDFLRDVNASGLEHVPDQAEEEDIKTVLIRDISDLEDGKQYRILFEGQRNSLASIRKEQTHLTQRREDEASQAVLKDVQNEDQTCILVPSLRVMKDINGRDEVEFDGVIMCESQAIVLSHKTNYTGASMVKEIAQGAQVIARKSSEAAYAGTRYSHFNGKKVVPAFMAEFTAATAEASLRRAGQEHGVKLYRRNGSSISPWACMTPLKRAAAQPAVLRWVV